MTGDLRLRDRLEERARQYRRAAALHPDKLEPILLLARDLRTLGRADEALAILQGARKGTARPSGYSDLADQLIWWWDGLGYAYLSLGRYDDMVTSFRNGGMLDEWGEPNVSQLLNLAMAQVRMGRGKDALDTLSAFDDPRLTTSPYGAMMLRTARGCGYSLTGNDIKADAELAYAIAHEKDRPRSVTELYLCRNDLNGAALSVIRRLGDPETTSSALIQLANYPKPAAASSPIASRLPALKARADVGVAIARAGGVPTFDVGSSEH